MSLNIITVTLNMGQLDLLCWIAHVCVFMCCKLELQVLLLDTVVQVNAHYRVRSNCVDTVTFLGISIVGQSNRTGDGGIYVGSIMKGSVGVFF